MYKNSTFPKQISYVYKTQLLKWTKLCDPKIEPTKKNLKNKKPLATMWSYLLSPKEKEKKKKKREGSTERRRGEERIYLTLLG